MSTIESNKFEVKIFGNVSILGWVLRLVVARPAQDTRMPPSRIVVAISQIRRAGLDNLGEVRVERLATHLGTTPGCIRAANDNRATERL